MRNIVFVAPFLMETTLRFVDAVRGLDNARVLGICQRQQNGIRPDQRSRFDELAEVDNCFDPAQLVAAARQYQNRHGDLFRILNVLENIQVVVAQARQELGLPGMDPDTLEKFLDKSVMKDNLRALGLPCAHHVRAVTHEDGFAFARRVGYPLVVKPPIGAGCKSTYLARTDDELRVALDEIKPAPERPTQIEEFITGEEHSFDTLTLGGKVQFYSLSHYAPGCLECVRNPWIQYTVLLPRDISGPEYADIRRVGIDTAEKLGMQDGLTHMEWFRRPDGSVAIGEIAARPPGAQITRMMGFAHDTSFYRVWARAAVDGKFDGPWERKYAVGCAFLRGAGHGRVAGYSGVEHVRGKWGAHVAEERLPIVGTPKSDSYEGDGIYIVRHEKTEVVREMLTDIISTFKVWYH